MRQLPYNQPQGNVFNYGKAVQDGQAIADNALQVRERSRQAQGQAASNALSQQGIQGQAKYDQLYQKGFGDIAKAEQTKDIARATAKNTYAKTQLEKVNSDASMDSLFRHLEQVGAVPYKDSVNQWGTDYNAAKPAIDKYLGRTTATSGASGKGKHFSGQDIYKDADGTLFMGTGVGDPGTGAITPSMVAVNGSGVKPKGKLNLVNTLGQTSGEIPDYKAKVLSSEVRSKDDATFYTDYIQETRNMESSIGELEMTQDLLDGLSGQTDYSSAGFAKFLNKIPLTDATKWAELKSTVQSRIAMGKMLELKEASATGSTGFGQLSEKELKVLMDHLGSLNQALPPKELKRVIKQIYESMEGVKKGYRNKMLQNRKRFKSLHTEYYGKSRDLPKLKEDDLQGDELTPEELKELEMRESVVRKTPAVSSQQQVAPAQQTEFSRVERVDR